MTTDNKLQRRDTTAMAVPEWMREEAVETLDFDQSELVIPRLAVCQSLTPQRKRSNENYVPGLEEGMLFNTLTGRIYDAPCKFVVLDKWRSNIYFDGGKIKCRSTNGQGCSLNGGKECCHSGWRNGATKQEQKPLCTEFFNYLVYLVEEKDWVVLSFKSTGLKTAKEGINAKLRLIQGMSDYAKVFELTTEEDKNDQGEFFVPKVKLAVTAEVNGQPTCALQDQDTYKMLKKAFAQIAGKAAQKVKVHDEAGDEPRAGVVVDDDIPF